MHRPACVFLFLAAGCASQPAAEPVTPAAPAVVVDTDPPKKSAVASKPAPKAETPEEARQKAIFKAREAGILGLLRTDPNAPKPVWGKQEELSEAEKEAIWSGEGLKSTEPRPSPGTGEGIGLGSIGIMGKGSGTGSGFGKGNGSLGQRSHVKTDAAKVEGSLDKELIRRIVRQHVSSIRSCYQKELAKKPNLAGRIAVRFVIDTDGKVSEAKAASGFDPEVDACVVPIFKGMTFPKPKGGAVIVNYPLVFTHQ